MIARRNVTIFLAFLMSGITLINMSAIAAETPVGTWLDHSGRGAIQISSCGEKLCGHLVWMREGGNAEACGAQIIGNARKVGGNLWDDGWIYSPEKNRKYNVELKPLSNGTLRVKGYAGSKMFSRTMIWKPAPSNLELCHNKTRETNDPVQQEKTQVPSDKKIAKADPLSPIETEKQTKDLSPSQTDNNGSSKSESASNNEQIKPQSSTLPTNMKGDDGAIPSKIAKGEADLESKSQGNKTKTKSFQSSLSTGSINQKFSELQRQTGFGITKIGNGRCRLKVPFVTIRIRCDD